MHMSKREFIKLAALFSSSALMGKNVYAGNRDKPLTIGYLPITDATPLLVAHHLGLYQEQGIEVTKPVRFRSWSQLVEAFISNKVNLVHVLSPMLIWLRYGTKAPVKMMTWNHTSGSALTVRPDINDIKALGGQTVAIPFWYSIHNVVLQHLFRSHGLDVVEKAAKKNEVRVIVMPPSDMVTALGTGKIAGFIVAEPFNAAAEHFKVGKILRFTADVWKDHACCVTLMHERDIQERPEWTQKVVNAKVKAQIWANQHREKTAELLSKTGKHRYTPHTSQVLKRVLTPDDTLMKSYQNTGAILHPEWHSQRIGFQPYPFPSYTEKLVEMLQQTYVTGNAGFLNELDPKQVASNVVEERFIRHALQTHQGFEAFNLPENLSRQELITV